MNETVRRSQKMTSLPPLYRRFLCNAAGQKGKFALALTSAADPWRSTPAPTDSMSSSKLYHLPAKAARFLLFAARLPSPVRGEKRRTRHPRVPASYSYHKAGGGSASHGWLPTIAAMPAVGTCVYMLQDQARPAEMERTFIVIKPDGVQRGLGSEMLPW